jgi:hypothetical protein
LISRLAELDLSGPRDPRALRALGATRCNPKPGRDLEWIATVDLEPKDMFADAVLRLDAALMVVMTKRRHPSIIRFFLHPRHFLADLG